MDTKEKEIEDYYGLGYRSPVYHIREDVGNISEEDLVDTRKSFQLKSKIDEEYQNGKISKEQRDFLYLAADRHNIFNYSKIADYYAQSSKEMQGLMEESALVIIDYNKAIEYGYARLGKVLQEKMLRGEL